jgi:hypothetical protein
MRAQVSADFIITLAIALAVFIFFFLIVTNRNAEFDEQKTRLFAKQLADKFAAEVNTVYLSGPGTSKTIELPNTLKDQTAYLINFYPQLQIVEIIWQTKQINRYVAPIMAFSGENITNINDDVNITFSEDGLSIDISQSANDCNSFCIYYGASYGICRKGTSKCEDNGELSLGGNSFCIRELGGVCCCG